MQLNTHFITAIESIIATAQVRAVRSVDTERVLMYWQIGRAIQEEEQQGKARAGYGDFLLKSLAENLEPKHGSGFSFRQLNLCRQFYRVFPIANALRSQFNWTHYRTLIRIENEDKRAFYIAETEKNNWTARQLERQINSQLFERLLLSNDVHSDIGQLQMYVNYYDRFEKQDFENPTIGILLCADKNDAMVKITLPENNKSIIASKYQLYLPTETQLIAELKKQLRNSE
jgi:DUF1016 N-terminal domain/YhcG PDDEXK nuclease domain